MARITFSQLAADVARTEATLGAEANRNEQSATPAPVLCVYCDDPDRPIEDEHDSVEIEETGERAHLGCYFSGHDDDEFEPVDPDALYDRLGDR